VYFLDNEDLFKRKFVFTDENEKWYDDNVMRTVFFCKGALETVKKFGWPPDVIHCSGWMTGLIPMYLKTIYKKEPVFAHSKVLYTLGPNTFDEKIGPNFLKVAAITEALKDKDLAPYAAADNHAIQRGGAIYADAISFGEEQVSDALKEEFGKAKGKKILPFKGDNSDLTDYLQLYNDLAGH
jgi:starch synthase